LIVYEDYQSSQCKSGTVPKVTNGRNLGTAGKVKTCLYNLWQVLRVAALTALSPERQKTSRSLSPLKPLMVSGEVGRTRKGRKTLLPGIGSMGVQMPPAGHLGTLKRRGINSPAPSCANVRFG